MREANTIVQRILEEEQIGTGGQKLILLQNKEQGLPKYAAAVECGTAVVKRNLMIHFKI